ncbi:hypothetical protein [Spirochaeta dissipatitropha]
MDPFMVSIVSVISIFVFLPAIVVGGIVASKAMKNKQKELSLRERELELEERRLALDESAYAQSLLEDK